MISFNNSDWLIPITQYYFYIINIWAYNSGMQIEDLAPFSNAVHSVANISFRINKCHCFLDDELIRKLQVILT